MPKLDDTPADLQASSSPFCPGSGELDLRRSVAKHADTLLRSLDEVQVITSRRL